MSSFSNLKRLSDNPDALAKQLHDSLNEKAYPKDERFWYPELDKSGNAIAIIRFLPAPAVDGDDALPIVKYFSHSFKGPTGKYYIENSLTTFKQPDPLAEFNSALWNANDSEESAERKQARAQKRKLNFIANILIVDYPANPSMNGQHKLYRFGQKVYNKINEKMFPEFAGEEKLIPFDFWTGANFKLVIKTIGDYPNYDSSAFLTPSPLSKDDDYLEALWKKEYSLKEFLDPKNFKSYDELKKRMEEVLELGKRSTTQAIVKAPKGPVTKSITSTGNDPDETPPWDTANDDGDPDMAYFTNLASSLDADA